MTENSDAGVVRQLLQPLDRFLKDRSLYELVINRPGEVLTEGAGAGAAMSCRTCRSKS